MEKNAGSELTYYEHHIQYVQKELDAEEIYRVRIKNAKAKYEHNLMVSSIGAIILFFILLFLAILLIAAFKSIENSQSEQEMFLRNKLSWVSLVSMLPLMVFLTIGFICCLICTIRGFTRIKGMTDPKTMTYQSYEAMQTLSEQRSIFLQKDLLETVAKSEAVKAVLKEKRNSQIESKEMKAINFSELREVLEEKV